MMQPAVWRERAVTQPTTVYVMLTALTLATSQ